MILPQAGLFAPPKRLPRRAVRGLGAHSPHQAGWGVSHGLADGSGWVWQRASKVLIESSKDLPSPIPVSDLRGQALILDI